MKRVRSEDACACADEGASIAHDRHFSHLACTRHKRLPRMRACVAVTERALCNMCILDGDGCIMTLQEDIDHVCGMLKLLGESFVDRLAGAEGTGRTDAAIHYARAIDARDFACVLDRNSVSCRSRRMAFATRERERCF